MTASNPYDVQAGFLASDVLAAIDTFWALFAENAAALDDHFASQKPEITTYPAQVMARLSDVSPDLMWEFGAAPNGHSLVITAEWQDENIVLAKAVRKRAPSLSRWAFNETRGPVDPEVLGATFEAMFRDSLHITGLSAWVNEAGRIDISVAGDAEERVLLGQAIQLVSLLLGEQEERNWLGLIDCEKTSIAGGFFSRLRRKPTEALDAIAARRALQDAIDQAKSERPSLAYSDLSFDDRAVSLFQFDEVSDGHSRPDLITFLAADARYGAAVVNTSRFSCSCHSQHGEWFSCLRLPNPDGEPMPSAKRGEIEERIHALLSRDGLGGVVAAGAGTEAAYIDIALTDVAQGLARLGQELRDQPFAAKTTIHFLDPGLTEFAHPLLGGAASVQ